MRLLITGICGKMGANVLEIAKDYGAEIVCGVDKNFKNIGVPVYSSFGEVGESVDAVIDFSSPEALREELEWAKKRKVPVVLAATGYSADDLKYIDECAKDAAVFSAENFSFGICLLKRLVAETAEALGECDVEIVEKHHRLKKDAPSGTALSLAESVNKAFSGSKKYLTGRSGTGLRGDEIGIHAVRGGSIVGEHEVIFAFGDEIITLSHAALSKKVFAAGALKAAKLVIGKPAGKYGTEDLAD